MTEHLLQAAVGITVAEPASQPLRRSSSVTSSSSSTSQQDPPESSQQAQPAPQMEAREARAITRIVNPATIASWHGFRLTWVPARKSSGHGSWQGTCPYHKKSFTGTACKKTLSVSADTVGKALLQIKNWCASAGSHNRYRDHMAQDPVLPPNNDEDAVVQMAISLLQSRQGQIVQRDNALDEAVASSQSRRVAPKKLGRLLAGAP